ncbi:beta-1,4-N-acetylgalactosaminyltransferase bre-4-like [Ostrinia nubilalis]|uniref:beta-1,4-N-acetylgalactosaminyltransferase bre-4-like n=1 Tax=Ostrinia furnacalis TaxID=93504 RepID=UPI00103DEDEE|nr:beta-1,4-N-acetylgalactosaminyltransferase bre-4-like [Ostrinia furnacalis]
MRNACKKKVLYCGIIIIVLIIFLHPDMNARRSYEYIEKELIPDTLYEETAVNFTSSAILECDYHDVLFDDTTLSDSLVDGDLIEGHRIREGGEFSPSDCKPKFSTAVIVPYRDRAEQLRGFLVYMHMFLRRQSIHYRIFVVEQVDTRPFNRAKLLNIGALAAMRAGYPCLVLHDVDLLPLRPANLYACTKCPRHMSSSINKFRFVLPYLNLFGGAIAITSHQYKTINGMSNEYFGWGGEDDDLYARMESEELKMCRFEPENSRYHMMSHKSQHTGDRRKQVVKYEKNGISDDGLKNLKYTEVATVLHPLFTHIMVDL